MDLEIDLTSMMMSEGLFSDDMSSNFQEINVFMSSCGPQKLGQWACPRVYPRETRGYPAGYPRDTRGDPDFEKILEDQREFL